MVMYRVLPIALESVLFAILTIAPAASQDVKSCRELTCGAGFADGIFPNCECNGQRIDVDGGVSEPENPTCALNFGCPDASYVGVGTWPECVCRGAENTGDAGSGLGDPGSFDPGAGGAATCSQFFTCPPRWRMDVGDDGVGCLCKEGGP